MIRTTVILKEQINRQTKTKVTRFPKDKAHYLTRKKAKQTDKDQRYIIYDIEANPRRLHIPNKLIAKEYVVPGKIEVDGDSLRFYKKFTAEENLIAEHVFNGPDCIDQFCERKLYKPYESKLTKQ